MRKLSITKKGGTVLLISTQDTIDFKRNLTTYLRITDSDEKISIRVLRTIKVLYTIPEWMTAYARWYHTDVVKFFEHLLSLTKTNMSKEKASEIFEGENSSLKKTFNEATMSKYLSSLSKITNYRR